jgi:acyl-CoA thioesterase FadM/ketosteroid isomerase-like protein
MQRDDAEAVLARLHQAQGELYAGGDDTGVRTMLTPDVVWHVPGDNAIAGHYHGIDQVLGYLRRRRDLAARTFTMTMRQLLVGPGDQVAALTDGTATMNGQQHTWSTVGLYRISGERIAECWLLPLDPQEFDAIWAYPSRAHDPDAAVASTSVFRTPVRPRHCDAQGMLHASRYYEYFEDAFLDWLDTHLGGYQALRTTGTDLVIVASGCEHHRGAALTDRLAIEVRPVAAGRTSLEMAFIVRDEPGTLLTVGRITYVAVATSGGAVALPERLRALTQDLPRRQRAARR